MLKAVIIRPLNLPTAPFSVEPYPIPSHLPIDEQGYVAETEIEACELARQLLTGELDPWTTPEEENTVKVWKCHKCSSTNVNFVREYPIPYQCCGDCGEIDPRDRKLLEEADARRKNSQ